MVTKRTSKKKSDRPADEQKEATAAPEAVIEKEEESLDPVQAAQEVLPADIDDEYEENQRAPQPMAGSRSISVKPSDSLYRKLCDQAAEEGLGVEEYCAELLAEGVVIRAWEIVEKKLTMRGGGNNSQQQHQNRQHQNNRQGQPHRGNNNNKSQGQGQGNNNRRGMSQSRYQNIMDDKATFLEYVRNQERKNNNR